MYTITLLRRFLTFGLHFIVHYWRILFYISGFGEDDWSKKLNYSENEQNIPGKYWFSTWALWKWRYMWCCGKNVLFLSIQSVVLHASLVNLVLEPLVLPFSGTTTTIGYFGAYTSISIKISWIGFLLPYA